MEPPTLPIQEALAKGMLGFRGHVTQLNEIRATPWEITGEAVLEVLEWYTGTPLKTTQLKLEYLVETTSETGMPVSFQLSSEVVVVLNRIRESGGRLKFSSDWKDGFDYAYVVVDSFPPGQAEVRGRQVRNVFSPGVVESMPIRLLNKARSHPSNRLGASTFRRRGRRRLALFPALQSPWRI